MFGYKIVKEDPDVLTMDEVRREIKRKERREAFKEKCGKVVDWIGDHKAGTATIAGGVFVGAKKAFKWNAARIEKRNKECDFWDPSKGGGHVITKRPLTRKELEEFYKSRERGEQVRAILTRMGLFKEWIKVK